MARNDSGPTRHSQIERLAVVEKDLKLSTPLGKNQASERDNNRHQTPQPGSSQDKQIT